MDIQLYVITPLAGAVIGYFTNWLAIKMLFRPHNKITLFKSKVTLPFTPGLIPKNRGKLAIKMGATVEKHLLTKDVLTKAITSEGTIDNFNILLDDFIEKMKISPMTISDIINNLIKNADGITTESLITGLSGFIFAKIIEALKSDNTASLEKLIESARAYSNEKGREFFNRETLQQLLQKTLNDYINGISLSDEKKCIREILPDNTVDWLKNAVVENVPNLAELLSALPEKHPDIEEKLRLLIKKIIDDNFGQLIGMFISHEKIYGNIKKSLLDYINNEESRKMIIDKANSAIDDFIAKDIIFLIEKLPPMENITDSAAGFVSELFENGLTDKIFDSALEFIYRDGDFTFHNLIAKVIPDLDERICNLTESVIKAQAGRLLDKTVGGLVSELSPSALGKIKEFLLSSLKPAIEKGADYLVGSLNISKMVEDKINEFEVSEAEEIIISVVSQELNAITVVGGVLGLVIGFAPALMNALY